MARYCKSKQCFVIERYEEIIHDIFQIVLSFDCHEQNKSPATPINTGIVGLT